MFSLACGGPMIPLSQTLLLRIFPKEKAAAATALWAVTTLIAPVAWRMLERYEDKLKGVPIDKVGLVLLIVAVGALQLMARLQHVRADDQHRLRRLLRRERADAALMGFGLPFFFLPIAPCWMA